MPCTRVLLPLSSRKHPPPSFQGILLPARCMGNCAKRLISNALISSTKAGGGGQRRRRRLNLKSLLPTLFFVARAVLETSLLRAAFTVMSFYTLFYMVKSQELGKGQQSPPALLLAALYGHGILYRLLAPSPWEKQTFLA